ncbi:sensor domain-containing diguanylate cyclase [Evansella sp. AB-P1]|uniref:sensor domain-containing diguanylate cyclase n=1 Tax=Evansella sp. AB-P1 TaxID=3037653 RepID=UPI00241E5B97|nr:sensor domain-containing diguanylate cyclase [Evansella sp. AB-P1]MDG5786869.1 sensor domain-containing diguanylate cyclase [Evansella sp. AB-P1]
MTEGRKKAVWIVWAIIFPIPSLFFLTRALPIIQEEWTTILAFLTLILLASLYPLRFRHTNIVPIHGISLAVFLQFGLAIELIVMQLAIITTLFRLKVSKKELYRLPLNSLVFFIVSITSAAAYYFLGGTTGSLTEINLTSIGLPIIAYAFIYFFLNNWLIFLIRKYLVNMKNSRFFDEALKWEAISAALIIPIGITLVLLYQQIGNLAIFIIGVPLVSLSLILKLYNDSEKTKNLLKKISSFGYQVNENLPVNRILDLFIHTVTSIFPVDRSTIFEKQGGTLKAIKVYNSLGEDEEDVSEVDAISQRVYKNGESKLYTKGNQWKEFVQGEINLDSAESVMVVPIIRNHEINGVITLSSNKQRAFEKSHLMLLEIMANYLAVAVENARDYEIKKQESERCALTNLYNFRYFENIILERYENGKQSDEFAIILLDLDHFKKINDTYGHQSGNEVLCQVADVLHDTVGDTGTLARYGGEEFVVLLEGSNARFAEEMAEAFRKEIESHLFSVSNDLGGNERKSVRITASIGVARKTEEEEGAMSVLRNADRAMYTGAKKKGRNRVSHF